MPFVTIGQIFALKDVGQFYFFVSVDTVKAFNERLAFVFIILLAKFTHT